MGWDGKERRTRKRYAIREGTLRYRRGGLLSALLLPGAPKLLLLNFSEEGCHFITREELQPGTPLRLRLQMPKIKGTVSATGQVAWCRKSAQSSAFRVGVRLNALSARSQALLKRMLDTAVLDNVDISTKAYLKEIERL